MVGVFSFFFRKKKKKTTFIQIFFFSYFKIIVDWKKIRCVGVWFFSKIRRKRRFCGLWICARYFWALWNWLSPEVLLQEAQQFGIWEQQSDCIVPSGVKKTWFIYCNGEKMKFSITSQFWSWSLFMIYFKSLASAPSLRISDDDSVLFLTRNISHWIK